MSLTETQRNAIQNFNTMYGNYLFFVTRSPEEVDTFKFHWEYTESFLERRIDRTRFLNYSQSFATVEDVENYVFNMWRACPRHTRPSDDNELCDCDFITIANLVWQNELKIIEKRPSEKPPSQWYDISKFTCVQCGKEYTIIRYTCDYGNADWTWLETETNHDN